MEPRLIQRALLGSLLILCQACLPVALPPTHVRVSGGTTVDSNPRFVAEWRAGVHPAQLAPKLIDRPLMIGVGYVGRSFQPLGVGHGAYFEAGWLNARRISKTAVQRLSVSVAPEMLHRDDAWGYGGALSIGVARTAFTSGGGAADRVAMASYGETELGLHLTGGFEHHAGRTYGFALAGVRGSIPGIAGVILAPELLEVLLP